jgi:aminopeptidase
MEDYARLLVERCLDVQPGWQVMIKSRPRAQPLVQAVTRRLAQRGAYALLRIGFGPFDVDLEWAKEAPEELVGEAAPADRHVYESIDAWMHITAPENTREGSELPADRESLHLKAIRPITSRRLAFEIPWVGCQYPTNALAQDAGMTLAAFTDFVLGACLRDWDAEAERMKRFKERFDAATEVRVVGAGTDLTLSLEGREGLIDDGHLNMPGGEFFFSPVEDATEGVVEFSEFPAVELGHEATGVRLVFEGGRVVDASAKSGEDYLIGRLDSDPGARVLGELGIGCNPAITQHTRNTLFDEKIDGTVHLAIGAGFPFLGSQNQSAVHWDMVKDLRPGGQVAVDGEVVQQDGRWLI